MRCRRWIPGSEVLYLFFQWSRQPNVPMLGHATRGVRLSCSGMHWLGVCHNEAILGASDPPGTPLPMNYSATLSPILLALLVSGPGWMLSLMEDEGDSDQH